VSAIPSFTKVGTHFADTDTADAIRVHTGGAGVLLGADQSGKPVTVSLFRPEPTFVVVIGQLGLAQLVSFRALGVGAALAVTTVRPSAWSALERTAVDTQGAVEITWPASRPGWFGSSLRPQLVLVDSDSTAAVGAMPTVHAWSTLITVREHIASRDTNLLGRADLILTQALSLQEAAQLCGAVNMTAYSTAFAALPERTIAVISHASVRSARLAPTAIERQLIGPLARTDNASPAGNY
jgi:hypothetical protein